MPKIISVADLRNADALSALCHAEREPVFITQGGQVDMVIMSIEAYGDLAGAINQDVAIREAENEYASEGILLDAHDALSALRKKHFG